LRVAFRNFRLDRVATLAMLDERFTPEAGKRYDDFIALMEQEMAARGAP
jgi:predicted DNA-binding transcriptional regulator YafY